MGTEPGEAVVVVVVVCAVLGVVVGDKTGVGVGVNAIISMPCTPYPPSR